MGSGLNNFVGYVMIVINLAVIFVSLFVMFYIVFRNLDRSKTNKNIDKKKDSEEGRFQSQIAETINSTGNSIELRQSNGTIEMLHMDKHPIPIELLVKMTDQNEYIKSLEEKLHITHPIAANGVPINCNTTNEANEAPASKRSTIPKEDYVDDLGDDSDGDGGGREPIPPKDDEEDDDELTEVDIY